jgi:endonuclease G
VKTLLLTLLILPTLSAQPARFGHPASDGPDREFAAYTFLLCYSSTAKVALWTAYELTPAHLVGTAKRPSHFRRDTRLTGPSASNDDYRGSGLHRGHLVPAADFAFSESTIRETFLLSNAVPQYPRTNSGVWRRLEETIRALATHSDALYIFTGVLFESPEPQHIGPGRVAVPSHTFKAVLALQGDSKLMYAAIVPNCPTATEPLTHFRTTVDEVETRTGLDFFSILEDDEENRLESTR